MPTQSQSHAGLRASLANVAWAVEERVVWGGVDVLKGAADVVKWPFERAAWTIERGLIWPLQERTAPWDGALRIAGIALVTVAAIGAGVAGLLWAAPDNGGNATRARVVAPFRPSSASQESSPEPGAPTLHGVAPVFTSPAQSGASEVTGSTATDAQSTTTPSHEPSPAASAPTEQPAGPAAIKVARQFASAFVLYETGAGDSEVRAIFHAAATPALAHSLLRRPPRLPANVKVPRARVLNVVPGPSHNGVYTISVSLLRVGLTSELRLDMQKDKSGNWQVTNVLG